MANIKAGLALAGLTMDALDVLPYEGLSDLLTAVEQEMKRRESAGFVPLLNGHGSMAIHRNICMIDFGGGVVSLDFSAEDLLYLLLYIRTKSRYEGDGYRLVYEEKGSLADINPNFDQPIVSVWVGPKRRVNNSDLAIFPYAKLLRAALLMML